MCPDPIFADPLLARFYDWFEADRSDLDLYLSLAEHLGAERVLDVGCGTGSFANLLATRGLDVVGVDPSEASLEVARTKPQAEAIRWVNADASWVPEQPVDLVVMTGNVAQVFLTDAQWAEALEAAHRSLRPDGHLLFEVRDPARQAWLEWTPVATRQRAAIPPAGVVTRWCEVIDVELPLVRLRHTWRLESQDRVLTSDSTLRFRERSEMADSLLAAGFDLLDVYDAPDRPGCELVFLAQSELPAQDRDSAP